MPVDPRAVPDAAVDSRPAPHPNRVEALAGARATLTILPAIAPFAALYGALATAAGFAPSDTLIASATIFAGASQYLMLDMLGQGLSSGAILLAVLAVNFRHVLYSAALGRRLGRFSTAGKALAFQLLVDPTFAAAEQRARTVGTLAPAWYFGYGLTVYVAWMVANVVGIASGRLLEDPARYGLDFILPLYFLGVLLGFRAAHGFVVVLATSALVSIGVHETLGAPWHLPAGALTGLAVAAARSRPPLAEATVEGA